MHSPRIRASLFKGMLVTLSACWLSIGSISSAQEVSLDELAQLTHFHGIAVHVGDSSQLYLATHNGLFVVDLQGRASRLSHDGNDYMGFTPHPSDPDKLFASGHPSGGGNMGFMASDDGGRTWRQLSPGARGPVDFHQMDVSKVQPDLVIGAFRGLQVSRDGGRTWQIAANLPDGTIDLAASATDADRVYVATRNGLLYSTDLGASWQPAHAARAPVSMVQTGHEGELYAFILGVGLVRTREPALDWTVVSNGFGERFLLHLAVDPRDPRRLYGVTNEQQVLTSADGGERWAPLGAAGRD